jgi:hypothetical protein
MQETNRESRAHAGNNQIFQSPFTNQSENQKPWQQAITYNPKPKQEAIKELRATAGSNPTIQSQTGRNQRIPNPCRHKSENPEYKQVAIR